MARTSYDVLLALEQGMRLLESEVYLEHPQQVFVTLVNSFLRLVNFPTRNCALHFLETILISKRLRFNSLSANRTKCDIGAQRVKMIKPSRKIHAQS